MGNAVQDYADRIWDAYVCGDDSIVFSIMLELNQDSKTYQEVWSLFGPGMRRALKDIEREHRSK
jgi:hypothetical protein